MVIFFFCLSLSSREISITSFAVYSRFGRSLSLSSYPIFSTILIWILPLFISYPVPIYSRTFSYHNTCQKIFICITHAKFSTFTIIFRVTFDKHQIKISYKMRARGEMTNEDIREWDNKRGELAISMSTLRKM